MTEAKTLKLWRRETHTSRLTGEIVAVEVIPADDLREHISSEDCECLPVLKQHQGAPMLVHRAFDGRDVEEKRGN